MLPLRSKRPKRSATRGSVLHPNVFVKHFILIFFIKHTGWWKMKELHNKAL